MAKGSITIKVPVMLITDLSASELLVLQGNSCCNDNFENLDFLVCTHKYDGDIFCENATVILDNHKIPFDLEYTKIGSNEALGFYSVRYINGERVEKDCPFQNYAYINFIKDIQTLMANNEIDKAKALVESKRNEFLPIPWNEQLKILVDEELKRRA